MYFNLFESTHLYLTIAEKSCGQVDYTYHKVGILQQYVPHYTLYPHTPIYLNRFRGRHVPFHSQPCCPLQSKLELHPVQELSQTDGPGPLRGSRVGVFVGDFVGILVGEVVNGHPVLGQTTNGSAVTTP